LQLIDVLRQLPGRSRQVFGSSRRLDSGSGVALLISGRIQNHTCQRRTYSAPKTDAWAESHGGRNSTPFKACRTSRSSRLACRLSAIEKATNRPDAGGDTPARSDWVVERLTSFVRSVVELSRLEQV